MVDNTSVAGPSRPPPAQNEAGATHAGPSSGSSHYKPLPKLSFPWAAQPEVVRAFQKDAYYRDLFVGELKDVVRSTVGVRVLHNHSELIAVLGGVAYFALCALNGAQTLGEEYVNAMMVEGKTGRIAKGKVCYRRSLGNVRQSEAHRHFLSPYSGELPSSLRKRCFHTWSQNFTPPAGVSLCAPIRCANEPTSALGYEPSRCCPWHSANRHRLHLSCLSRPLRTE